MRQCGDCQLCCKLLPVPEIDKLANAKCKHQRHHVGCTVYRKRGMPMSCAIWNCRWLANDDTHDLSRPDRSHYVIDIMPDHITAQQEGVSVNIEVVQIWVDPGYRDAHRETALRRYLARLGERNIAAIVRWSASDAVVLLPPSMTDGQWHEITGQRRDTGYSLLETAKALQSAPGRIVPSLDQLTVEGP